MQFDCITSDHCLPIFAFHRRKLVSCSGNIAGMYIGHELGTGVPLGRLISTLLMYTGLWEKYTYKCINQHGGKKTCSLFTFRWIGFMPKIINAVKY